MSDLNTDAIVVRRTNLGEADRLIDFLTPQGRITALAKSVRKEKSRLAGGVEMFCVSNVVLHTSEKTGRTVITSAKLKKFYKNILADFNALETASEIIKQIARASSQIDNAEYFFQLKQSLETLDKGADPNLVKAWFYLNFARAQGEQINLLTDYDGEKLSPEETYVWDISENVLKKSASGPISADEIKIMRLMITSPLTLILKIKNVDQFTPDILYIAKTINQL